jgi:hypothetical protein
MGAARQDGPPAGRRRLAWAAGAVFGGLLAVAAVGGVGEAYVRLFPPRDLHSYLGDDAPDRGPFAPDPEFGVGYRSWQAFRADNPRLDSYLPFDAPDDPRPVWAFFGNSFVQAPGMLADTARARLPGSRIFNLGRNEHLCVRLAQIRLLLEHGLRPERVVVELMPLDAAVLGPDPLDSLYVTPRGALTVRPRLPDGPAGWLVGRSALARTAWFRTGRHHADPDFSASRLDREVGPRLAADLDRLFAALARAAGRHAASVTVLLIPNYEQIARGAPCGFQDALGPALRACGLDVCDPRDAFRAYPDKPSLFIPDRHFSDCGNRLLLAELLRHLKGAGAPATGEVDPP